MKWGEKWLNRSVWNFTFLDIFGKCRNSDFIDSPGLRVLIFFDVSVHSCAKQIINTVRSTLLQFRKSVARPRFRLFGFSSSEPLILKNLRCCENSIAMRRFLGNLPNNEMRGKMIELKQLKFDICWYFRTPCLRVLIFRWFGAQLRKAND